MDSREIVSVVTQHLMAQGTRSGIGNRCAYRGEQGLMCAVGVLIPDSEYRESMDYGISQLEDVWRECPTLQKISRRLLSELQGIHDCYSVGDWERELTEVSAKYGK